MHVGHNVIFSITLQNGLEEKYQIVVGGNYSYAILPRPVEAVWTVGDYVYNGSNQGPSVDAKDINGVSLEYQRGKHFVVAVHQAYQAVDAWMLRAS